MQKGSIWEGTATLPKFQALPGDRETDVLIIGGGLAGILCATMLAREGVEYILLEADRIMGGVSANTTAKVTAQHGLIYHKLLSRWGAGRALMYYEANREALRAYRELAATVDCDMETKDSFVYSRDNRRRIEREMAALARLGIPGEYREDLPLPFSVAGAVRLKDQGQLNPVKLAAGLVPGLSIYEKTAAIAYAGDGTVVTTRGRVRARRVIVATHFPIFNSHGLYFLKMYQHRSYVLGLRGAPALEGMYVDERMRGLSFRMYGEHLLLGGGAHRTGKRGGGWEELAEVARREYPSAEIEYRFATQDCMTLDDVPYIGRYARGTRELYVATGFNKWGMTSAMVAARLLTDLVVGRRNPYASLFDPGRSILRPQLAVNLAESAVGFLTPTVPRCPHLGCALTWNKREHTWDCPCHGSRFSAEGECLTGPANGDVRIKRQK